jgi:hypothetical protein
MADSRATGERADNDPSGHVRLARIGHRRRRDLELTGPEPTGRGLTDQGLIGLGPGPATDRVRRQRGARRILEDRQARISARGHRIGS